jgi:hypothetical protein
MALKEWYGEWTANMGTATETINEVFTEELWDEFLDKKAAKAREIKEEASRLKLEESRIKFEESDDSVKVVSKEASSLNVSYKVETKEIPKLPANKSLKGKIFDEWQGNFYVKMCQAKVDDILGDAYIAPLASDEGYELYKTKDDFVKNHLLTATMGSNAASFINVKTMTGIEMYSKLLDVFQGQEHEEDAAINASTLWEKLKFNRHTKYAPETFLSKVNECLKRMEVDDGTGTGKTTKPFSNSMLPSMLRAKIEHPSFVTWKALSENAKEDWSTVQVTFLREASKTFGANHDSSSKFRTATQRSEEAKGLTEKERKIYQKALQEGKRVQVHIFKKLSAKEKEALNKAKNEKWKERNNGGLGLQYSTNQQLSSLPAGTILVPMLPQGQSERNIQGQANNALLSGGSGNNNDNVINSSSSSLGQESN